MRLFTAWVALALPLVQAVFQDEAGKLDFHHALLGSPQEHTTFFHRPQLESKAALLYTLTDIGRLGAIKPKDGTLVWRQQLSQPLRSNTSFLLPNGASVISGHDDQIASWSAVDGKLIWSIQKILPGTLVDLNTLSVRETIALIQSDTGIVQAIDGLTGKLIWQYKDTSSETPFKLATSPSTIYYISLSTTNKIKVTALDPSNGKKLDTFSLASDSDVTAPEDIQLQSRAKYPIIAWSDKSNKNIKVNVLGSKAITTIPIIKEATSDAPQSIKIHASSSFDAPPHVFVEYKSELGHWGDIVHIIPSGKSNVIDPSNAAAKKIYQSIRLAGKGTVASSLTDSGQLYFTRVAKGKSVVLFSESEVPVQQNSIADFGYGTALDYPDAIFSVGEVNAKDDGSLAVRTATWLSSDDLVLIANGKHVFTRPEGLAYISNAIFAEKPKKQNLAQELAIEEHSSALSAYIHRITRHLKDLESLPQYIQQLPQNLLAGITGQTDLAKDDLFGFDKYVIAYTRNKRILALDAANGGRVVWSVSDQTWSFDETPKLSISTQGVVSVKFSQQQTFFNMTNGNLLFDLPSNDQNSDSQLPEPETIVTYTTTGNTLIGSISESSLWIYKPPLSFTISHITTRPLEDPVAQIGDALGDRRVLYKYLNPNIVFLISISTELHAAHVALLDAVSGNELWSTMHDAVDTTQAIPAILSENWLVYSYVSFPSPALSKSRGPVLVSAHLFESKLPDDRGALGAASNYSTLSSDSHKALKPHVIVEAFHIPEPISHLSVTRTTQGITSRHVLAVLPQSGSLVGLPLQLLNPRRPIGRDPTKTEAEEGLLKYLPVLEMDPSFVLSHRNEILGLQNVIAEPATLESTSLIFAWGVGGDVFGTRVSPSGPFDVLGPQFNKVQLILTVVGTWVAVVLLAPVVARKGNNIKWEIL